MKQKKKVKKRLSKAVDGDSMQKKKRKKRVLKKRTSQAQKTSRIESVRAKSWKLCSEDRWIEAKDLWKNYFLDSGAFDVLFHPEKYIIKKV